MISVIESIHDIVKIIDYYKQNFFVERINFSDSLDWFFKDGALIHKSRGFFSIVGIEDEGKNQHLLMYQPQHAITGLLTSMIDGKRCYLIQARAEPGNINGIQFGPTVQSTPANYMRLHGGNTTPYLEWFIYNTRDVKVVSESTQLDFGERYLYKCKRLIIVELSVPVESHDNYVWISHDLFIEMLNENNLFNLDLRSLFSLLPWNYHAYEKIVINSNRIANVLNHFVPKSKNSFIIDLRNLSNWDISDLSISEKIDRQNFSVSLYKITTKGREINNWVQPLISSHSFGKVILLYRKINGYMNVLVSINNEIGLSSGCAIFPTCYYYPGNAPRKSLEMINEIIEYNNIDLISTVENSDEGGRFYQDVSYYELYKVDNQIKIIGNNLVWLNLKELYIFLNMSNIVSIQLRAAISQLFVKNVQ